MIQAMRQLALDFLYNELGGTGNEEDWYRDLRQNNMGALFPYLVEKARDSMSGNYYVLYPDPNDTQVAILEQRVLRDEDKPKLPFVQSTGSQSPALGPVIKRSFLKAKGAGPSEKILISTLKAFEELGKQDEVEAQPWSIYFAYACQLLSRPIVRFNGKAHEGKQALLRAVELLDESKTTFLSILDSAGRLPGERQDYRNYLQDILATEKYSTGSIVPLTNQVDALTGESTTVYPNSLAGAGLNLTNVDRIGTFSNLDESNAWKKFSLGVANADLLYTFSFHMRSDFVSRVAGEQALVLPHLSFKQEKRLKFVKRFKDYLSNLQANASAQEKRLLRYYQDSPDAVANITIIWADFGQKLENVTGIVSDILPSRLSSISDHITGLKNTSSPVFPTYIIEEAEPDLAFNSLGTLLKRPGGLKTKKANESAQLFEFKRDLAARVYHGRQIALGRFWDEVLDVAYAYLMDIAETGNSYGLITEGESKKGRYLTLAGWTKHLAKYLYFLKQLEVYPSMNNWHYQPKQEMLQRFFSDSQATAGLDTTEKVYAFLLGVLFGKVMEVQAARGVNVGANALTWLKRLNLTGADLPGLYIKVREKLLVYETESRGEVRAIVEELGLLGAQIGAPKLSKTDTCYYLLLGQSLTYTLIPPKKEKVA
jgi:CRISPR-associated protein Csh1